MTPERFECGGEETRAEAFAERRQPVEQFWSRRDAVVHRDFVKQVAAERIEPAGDAIVRVGVECEFAKNIVVQTEHDFGFGTRALIFAFREKLRDGEEAIGYALHRGDDYDNVRAASDRLHQLRGVQHALSTEQRSAAELEGDDLSAIAKRVACRTNICRCAIEMRG